MGQSRSYWDLFWSYPKTKNWDFCTLHEGSLVVIPSPFPPFRLPALTMVLSKLLPQRNAGLILHHPNLSWDSPYTKAFASFSSTHESPSTLNATDLRILNHLMACGFQKQHAFLSKCYDWQCPEKMAKSCVSLEFATSCTRAIDSIYGPLPPRFILQMYSVLYPFLAPATLYYELFNAGLSYQ
jgi:hypothetical protein